LFLWFLASVGHVAWTVQAINYLHSTRFRNWWIRLVRKALHLFQMIGPFAFLWFWGEELWESAGLVVSVGPLRLGCFFPLLGIGGGYMPWMLFKRWTRKTPAVVEECTGYVVRVAEQLGCKPAGEIGFHALLARLPWNQVFDVEIVERTLRLPQLPPAWDGLTL